jgi:hypothetical protein
MKLTITIDSDNDAFEPDPGPELARILKDIARKIADTNQYQIATTFPLYDMNGNFVGKLKYENEEASKP